VGPLRRIKAKTVQGCAQGMLRPYKRLFLYEFQSNCLRRHALGFSLILIVILIVVASFFLRVPGPASTSFRAETGLILPTIKTALASDITSLPRACGHGAITSSGYRRGLWTR